MKIYFHVSAVLADKEKRLHELFIFSDDNVSTCGEIKVGIDAREVI